MLLPDDHTGTIAKHYGVREDLPHLLVRTGFTAGYDMASLERASQRTSRGQSPVTPTIFSFWPQKAGLDQQPSRASAAKVGLSSAWMPQLV